MAIKDQGRRDLIAAMLGVATVDGLSIAVYLSALWALGMGIGILAKGCE